MATTYQLSAANSDLTGGADFSKALVQSGATTGTQVVSLSASETRSSYGFAPAGSPGNGGTSSGSFSAVVDISAVSNSPSLRCALGRINSAGVLQAADQALIQTVTAAGLYTFNWSNPALGTWAAGDRLRVTYILIDIGNGPGNTTFRFSSSSTVTAPWTIAAAAPFIAPRRRMSFLIRR